MEIETNRHLSIVTENSMTSEALAHSLSRELGVAIEAAKIAGAYIKNSYDDESANISDSIGAKSHGDWVSEVDKEADRLICAYLRRSFANVDILSEEGGVALESSRSCWIVDPLDGTSAFLFKTAIDQPSVMIALRDGNNRSVLGVVYFPLTCELYFAERGKGAYRGNKIIESATKKAELSKGHVLLNHYGDSSFESEWFRQASQNLRRPGGAGLVTVAAPHSGAACRVLDQASPIVALIHDNNPAKIKQDVWDIAAPQVIVEEAGGVFCDVHGNPYGLTPKGPIVVATNRAIAETVLRCTA